ncbi:hypothetical protein COCHEDRAFT_1030863 [Bipolaris maydis C5]|uniref:SNF2 N-terminal domain-containing protein n=2 Tax=cellular organisms TaxID=131567 RepID=M2TX84_COCH5|nr:hypothetical protein COCHEDRAFT_1030863 [Bipolaris maydis C5]
MALGKTTKTISLIITDRALGRSTKDATKAALILAPVSVMSNWSNTDAESYQPGTRAPCHVLAWTKKGSPSRPRLLRITMWSLLRTSLYRLIGIRKSPLPCLVSQAPFSIKWRRVIMDEAHNILLGNPKAKKTLAISNLMGSVRDGVLQAHRLSTTPQKYLYTQVPLSCVSQASLDCLFSDVFPQRHHASPLTQGSSRSFKLLMSDICLPSQERNVVDRPGDYTAPPFPSTTIKKFLQLSIDSQEDCPIYQRPPPPPPPPQHTFTSSPETTTLLASLSVCSQDLNLIAANQVIPADSWWAPAIERIRPLIACIGWARRVRRGVFGSWERVLGISGEKRRLAGMAFAEKEGVKRGIW